MPSRTRRGRDGLARVEFRPAEWIVGTRALTMAETAVYIDLLALLHQNGAPIHYDPTGLARALGTNRRRIEAIVARLIAHGKLIRRGDRLGSVHADDGIGTAPVGFEEEA